MGSGPAGVTLCIACLWVLINVMVAEGSKGTKEGRRNGADINGGEEAIDASYVLHTVTEGLSAALKVFGEATDKRFHILEEEMSKLQSGIGSYNFTPDPYVLVMMPWTVALHLAQATVATSTLGSYDCTGLWWPWPKPSSSGLRAEATPWVLTTLESQLRFNPEYTEPDSTENATDAMPSITTEDQAQMELTRDVAQSKSGSLHGLHPEESGSSTPPSSDRSASAFMGWVGEEGKQGTGDDIHSKYRAPIPTVCDRDDIQDQTYKEDSFAQENISA